MKKKKLFRVAAVPGSLSGLLYGQLRFMNAHYEVVGVASEDSLHQHIQTSEGVRTVEINISRRIDFLQDLASLYQLYKLFRNEKPHIVHSITPKAGLLSMLAAYLAKVPHRLHTFTGLIFPSRTGFMQKLLIFFDKVICYCATEIYPEGQGVKNDLINFGITKKKLTIIGHGNVNGIDLAYFDPALFTKEQIHEKRHILGIAEDDFVFLFVGRIVSEKGIEELVNAFSELHKNIFKVKLVLVGSFERELDPIPYYIEEEIKKNQGIILAGFQGDVRPFFALCNVFVLPSYREGFPNVVLQSGAMGKYSIVTDINGSNEIITEGLNGTIVPIKDSEALKAAMMACLNAKTEYLKTNMNHRRIIQDKYEQRFVWSELLKEYQKLT